VDFFVSHAGPDRVWAEWVAWHLQEAGYTVELDAWDWGAGENFVTRMHAAVDAANRVIALLSSAYFADGRYTADEWSSALIKDDAGRHRLLPVQIERCPLPRLLRPLLQVELFDVDQEEAARRLLAAVRGPRRPDGAPLFPGTGAAGVLTSRGETDPRLPGVLPEIWNVGPRNPGFVGREADLVAVHERLRSNAAAVVQALHGMGGVGKTQLAIEYAHRYGNAYDIVWWINTEEVSLIGDQYAALAGELGLTGPRTDTASAVSAVRGHLRRRGKWLLVFDNAESARDVRDWLPAGPGHTLITSRNPGWGELAARVDVDVLPRRESLALLRTFRPDLDEAAADRLAAALGDLPLALTQAGGFLAETGIPAGQYLNLLTTRVGELLDQSPPEAHPHSLAAAIRLATDRLDRVDPAAVALVRVGAFLAPEFIPAEVLTRRIPSSSGQPQELRALAAAVANPIAALRSLGRIGRYGLARVDGGLLLHRLTQAMLRDRLTAHETTAYLGYAQALLVAADPGDEHDPAFWPGWARILPHLLAADPESSSNPELRDLACRAAWYLYHRGQPQEASLFADHLHLAWRDALGPDDPHTLRMASALLRSLTYVGPYDRARDLGEDTLARSRRTFGDDHPDTLRAAHLLSSCLHHLGAFQQARHLNEDTLARRQRLLGHEHHDTMSTAHNLARDLRALGEAQAARRLHEDVLARKQRILGPEHPSTFNTTTELACDLHTRGQVEAARQLNENTLAQTRRILGDDHMFTTDCANQLARDLFALGEVEAARHLGEDTVARIRRVHGDGSVATIDAANNLAAALNALGENESARRLSEHTLDWSRRSLGEDHPFTLRAADNLAAALHALKEDETEHKANLLR
jgi:hypothetical protein